MISPAERERARRAQPAQRRPPDAARRRGRGRPALARLARATASLVEEDEPGFWWLSQDYVGPDGVARTREGLVAALRVEPYESRVVLPHERTHRGPKEGRLRLLREVGAQLEPLFFLYEGAPPVERARRASPTSRSRARASGGSRPTAIAEAFADRQLLIADGHHRYETALAYHEEEGTAESAFVLAVLVSLDDPGLMIFPTHRVFEHEPAEQLPAERSCRSRRAPRALEQAPPDRAAAVVYRDGGAGSPSTAKRARRRSSSTGSGTRASATRPTGRRRCARSTRARRRSRC